MKGKPSRLSVHCVCSGKLVADDRSLPAAVGLPTFGLHKRRNLQGRQTASYSSFSYASLPATQSQSALFTSNTLCWMTIHQARTGLFGDQSCPYANDLQQLPDICKPQRANWTHHHTEVSDPASISWQKNNCVFKFTYPALGTTPALL